MKSSDKTEMTPLFQYITDHAVGITDVYWKHTLCQALC